MKLLVTWARITTYDATIEVDKAPVTDEERKALVRELRGSDKENMIEESEECEWIEVSKDE